MHINRQRAIKIANMATNATDEALQRDARRMLARVNAIPMSAILDMVPGNINEKAALIGVSRTTIWYWVNGYNRPRNKAAKQLAKITGLRVDEIRGREGR